MFGILFVKCFKLLDMSEPWVSGTGTGAVGCSGRLLWQVPCPADWLALPCSVVSPFLKGYMFSVSSN